MLSIFLFLKNAFNILPLIQTLTAISSAKLTRTLIAIIVMSIFEAEAFYKASEIQDPIEENKEKEKIFIEELTKAYELIDKDFDCPEIVDSFVKNIFIPEVKNLVLPILKKFGWIKKLDPNQVKKITDPNFIGPLPDPVAAAQ